MQVNARQLFASFEDGAAWGKWMPVISSVEWTSPKPFSTGATRTVTLLFGAKLEEVFWAWEPDRHVAFCITRSSNGMVGALSESYGITPIDDHGCTLLWRAGLELGNGARSAEKYMAPWLERVMHKLMARLERVAAAY